MLRSIPAIIAEGDERDPAAHLRPAFHSQLVDRRETLQNDIRRLTDQIAYLRDLHGIVSQLLTARAQNNKQNEVNSKAG